MVEQLKYSGFDARSDVEDVRSIEAEREDVRAYYVSDIYVVARLLSVSVDDRLLAANESLTEDRDDARFAMGILPRSVHVGVSQDDMLDLMNFPIVIQILFDRILGDPVG